MLASNLFEAAGPSGDAPFSGRKRLGCPLEPPGIIKVAQAVDASAALWDATQPMDTGYNSVGSDSMEEAACDLDGALSAAAAASASDAVASSAAAASTSAATTTATATFTSSAAAASTSVAADPISRQRELLLSVGGAEGCPPTAQTVPPAKRTPSALANDECAPPPLRRLQPVREGKAPERLAPDWHWSGTGTQKNLN